MVHRPRLCVRTRTFQSCFAGGRLTWGQKQHVENSVHKAAITVLCRPVVAAVVAIIRIYNLERQQESEVTPLTPSVSVKRNSHHCLAELEESKRVELTTLAYFALCCELCLPCTSSLHICENFDSFETLARLCKLHVRLNLLPRHHYGSHHTCEELCAEAISSAVSPFLCSSAKLVALEEIKSEVATVEHIVLSVDGTTFKNVLVKGVPSLMVELRYILNSTPVRRIIGLVPLQNKSGGAYYAGVMNALLQMMGTEEKAKEIARKFIALGVDDETAMSGEYKGLLGRLRDLGGRYGVVLLLDAAHLAQTAQKHSLQRDPTYNSLDKAINLRYQLYGFLPTFSR